jgi:hypothetical protein
MRRAASDAGPGRSAEREGVGAHAGVEERDLEQALADRVGLAEQLVVARFADGAVAPRGSAWTPAVVAAHTVPAESSTRDVTVRVGSPPAWRYWRSRPPRSTRTPSSSAYPIQSEPSGGASRTFTERDGVESPVAGSKREKLMPSKRWSPSPAPSQRYPSGVCAIAAAATGAPSRDDHARWTSCASVGSGTCAAAKLAPVSAARSSVAGAPSGTVRRPTGSVGTPRDVAWRSRAVVPWARRTDVDTGVRPRSGGAHQHRRRPGAAGRP